jgi:hypothetical protein
MAKRFKEFRVFIASPGDLSPERKVFKDTIDKINQGYGQGAKIKFVAYGWEDELATTGFRVQSVINKQIDQTDVFVLVLHRRWGQKAPDSKYSSYTEEEFYRAYSRWGKMKKPVIMIFFKNIDGSSLADPGSQLKKVLKFKKQLKSLNVLHKSFATETDFGDQLNNHLRAFAEGRWEILNEDITKIEISENNIKSQIKSESQIKHKIKKKNNNGDIQTRSDSQSIPDQTLVLAERESLVLARAAIRSVNAGNIDDAKVLFAKASEGTTNLSILSVAVEFYRQTGDIDNANQLIRRLSAITNDREIAATHLLRLFPPNYFKDMQNSILQQMTASLKEEEIGMLYDIYTELTTRGIWEKFFVDVMIRNYSTEEIMALAQLYSTAAGQSIVFKQSMVTIEAMQFGSYAFSRIARDLTGNDFKQEVNPDYDRILGIVTSKYQLEGLRK